MAEPITSSLEGRGANPPVEKQKSPVTAALEALETALQETMAAICLERLRLEGPPRGEDSAQLTERKPKQVQSPEAFFEKLATLRNEAQVLNPKQFQPITFEKTPLSDDFSGFNASPSPEFKMILAELRAALETLEKITTNSQTQRLIEALESGLNTFRTHFDSPEKFDAHTLENLTRLYEEIAASLETREEESRETEEMNDLAAEAVKTLRENAPNRANFSSDDEFNTKDIQHGDEIRYSLQVQRRRDQAHKLVKNEISTLKKLQALTSELQTAIQQRQLDARYTRVAHMLAQLQQKKPRLERPAELNDQIGAVEEAIRATRKEMRHAGTQFAQFVDGELDRFTAAAEGARAELDRKDVIGPLVRELKSNGNALSAAHEKLTEGALAEAAEIIEKLPGDLAEIGPTEIAIGEYANRQMQQIDELMRTLGAQLDPEALPRRLAELEKVYRLNAQVEIEKADAREKADKAKQEVAQLTEALLAALAGGKAAVAAVEQKAQERIDAITRGADLQIAAAREAQKAAETARDNAVRENLRLARELGHVTAALGLPNDANLAMVLDKAVELVALAERIKTLGKEAFNLAPTEAEDAREVLQRLAGLPKKIQELTDQLAGMIQSHAREVFQAREQGAKGERARIASSEEYRKLLAVLGITTEGTNGAPDVVFGTAADRLLSARDMVVEPHQQAAPGDSSPARGEAEKNKKERMVSQFGQPRSGSSSSRRR